MRDLGTFSNLPIIAVTGRVMTGERERCLAAGANNYIPKPVITSELLIAIQPLVAGRRIASAMTGAP